jgi:hypothetical protein
MPLVLIIVTFIIAGCGGQNERIIERPVMVPGDRGEGGSGGGGALTFSQIQPNLRANCALSNCHAGAAFLSNEASFRRSSSCSRTENDNMPRRNSPRYNQWISDPRLKDSIVDFCNQ